MTDSVNKPAHSRIGASSYYRWAACPGSVKMCEGIESKSSSYADEGTRAHEAAAYFLEKMEWPDSVDSQMIEDLRPYVELFQMESSQALSTDVVKSFSLAEHRFDLSALHPGLFGTADGVVYESDKKILHVYDLKFGKGIPVEVENNSQLMYYGLGALLSTKVPCKEVELVIVQPRCSHPDGIVRRWRFSSLELIDFGADLVSAAKRTEEKDAPLLAGSHCRFCPAAGICPKLHDNALEIAKNEFRSDLSYDPKKLADVLHKLPVLEAFIKQVREFAYSESEHGRVPPGWKLVAKRATRKWKNESDAANIIADAFNLSSYEIFERKLKSPAQIEKFLLNTATKEIIADLVVSESSGYTLAPENDKRPSKNSADLFTDIEVSKD